MQKKDAIRLWHKARNWDKKTRARGKHGGIIGRAGLSVLYALIHDFLSFSTGRLDPAVRTIAKAASVAERTAYTALRKLRQLGLLNWQRRCEHAIAENGRFMLRQTTNAYQLHNHKQWLGYVNDDPPPPDATALGLEPKRHDIIDRALLELAAGNHRTAYADLMSDQGDRLAVALAQFGRALGAV